MPETDARTAPFRFRILTLFPEMINQAASHSIIGRARTAGLLEVGAVDIRDFTTDRHRTADDVPFGGGPGMVMKPEPVAAAIRAARTEMPGAIVVLMSASGRIFTQEIARRYAASQGGLILVCGHYEGVDERIAEHFCDEEICVGDYVLSGGELPALTVMDATARLIPGVLGNFDSLENESHNEGVLECPQYTRPRDFEGLLVPEVLFSGNHAEIEKFRREKALAKTAKNRPDLLAGETAGAKDCKDARIDSLAGDRDGAKATAAHMSNKPESTSGAMTPAGWGRPKDE